MRDIGGLAQVIAMGLDDSRQKWVVLSYFSSEQEWLTSWTENELCFVSVHICSMLSALIIF